MIPSKSIRKVRSKPRPGRLKGKKMTDLRMFVFERDGFKCQHIVPTPLRKFMAGYRDICGVPVTWDTGHLAHIVSRGAGGQDTPENTYCCCEAHHMTFHAYGPSMEKPVPMKPQTTHPQPPKEA